MRGRIAGGGTGGHGDPGIAMYEALKAREARVDVLFVGAKAGVEHRIFSDLGLPNVLLPGRGVRGKGLAAKLTSPFVFVAGILCGIREIRTFKPDVVIGTGGYASVAAVAGAVVCGCKRVLQEQNSVPGLANRVLSRFADLVLLSYEESKRYMKRGVRTAVVGNPIRVDRRADRAAGFAFFGLDPARPTVLVCGGSRGARSLNRAAAAAIPRLLEKRRAQFVFLAGDLDFETAKSGLERFGSDVRVFPFLEEMHHAYSVADVAVSRAGASAVFELAAFGVPTVFVPYPWAADDHQRKNVARLLELGAAIVVNDAELSGEKFQELIEGLLDDGEKRAIMARGMKNWAKPDADAAAAREIIDLVSGRGAAAPERGSARAGRSAA
jgi:UDP-N-acetylglucosamine--N-acetylmuramyl-(pentapeptide) pyrophosphoryl-undecaprenol N-acetylglucosamine transferase